MNCRNCGSSMRWVAGRNYSVCDYCTSFHFQTESPSAVDSVHVLPTTADHECPICHILLQQAAIAGRPVQHCDRCKGVLASNDAFAQIVCALRSAFAGEKVTPVPIEPRDLQRLVACPRCRRTMDVHPYYGPGSVVVDTCGQCLLIWLDHGEIASIQKAPGANWQCRPRRVV